MSEKMWEEKEIEFLKENYLNMSYPDIGKILDRSRSSVQNKCHKSGLKKPDKYSYNKDYFEIIDTEEKSYWLGFIYADGYVCNDYESSIELQDGDSGHLEKLNRAISGDFTIKHFNKKVNNKEHKMCSIRIYSKKINHDLKKHGVFLNKTHIIEFPNIREDLIRHFIRGYFDGNGSIFSYKRTKDVSYLRCKITMGSEVFAHQLKDIFERMELSVYLISGQNVFDVGISNLHSTKKFLEYIYSDCSIFLDRKMNKYNTHKHLLQYSYKGWNKRYD